MSLLEQLAAQAQVTGDVGEKLDQALETGQAEVYRLQGGSTWLKAGTKGVGGLTEHIRKDFEDGKFEGLDAKAIHDLLLDWNRKAVECMISLADQKKGEGLAAEGKLVGLKEALKLVQHSHNTATNKASQIMAQLDEPPIDEAAALEVRRSRGVGEHPGISPLDARRVEAMRESLAAFPKVTEATLLEDPPIEMPPAKRRGRKKKATR